MQVRVYGASGVDTRGEMRGGLVTDEVRSSQAFFEFVVSRRLLFAGRSGGLHAMAPGDLDFLTGFSTHGFDPFDARPGETPAVTAARPRRPRTAVARDQSGPPALCLACHNLPGVYSFHAFSQAFPAMGVPRARLSVAAPPDLLASAVAWKQKRPEWILLQRLLREAAAPSR